MLGALDLGYDLTSWSANVNSFWSPITIPLSVTFSWLILKKRYNKQMILTTQIVTLGIVICALSSLSHGNFTHSIDLFQIIRSFISYVIFCLRNVVVDQRVSNLHDFLFYAFISSYTQYVVLMPLCVWLENACLPRSSGIIPTLTALVSRLLVISVIKTTSAVSYINVRSLIAPTVALVHYTLYERTISLMMILGASVTLVGAVWYASEENKMMERDIETYSSDSDSDELL